METWVSVGVHIYLGINVWLNFHMYMRIHKANNTYAVYIDLHCQCILEKSSINHVGFLRALPTKSEVCIILKFKYLLVIYVNGLKMFS